MSLLDLADDCIAHVATLFTSAKDILALQATCRRFRDVTRASKAWSVFLRRDFGLVFRVWVLRVCCRV